MSGSAEGTRRPLYAMLAANFVSFIGNEFSYIAIPWFVLETTGSAALTGIVAATSVVPLVLSGLFGGVLVDRLGFKQSAVLSDVASAVNVALIPLLHLTVGLPFAALLALVFLGAILDAPGATARQSLYPNLVAAAGMPLERANSIWMIASRTAGLLGAPFAGLLIAAFGADLVLWVDAASFVISSAIITTLVPGQARLSREGTSATTYLQDLAEGFRFIRGDRLIVWLLVTGTVGSFLAEPIYSVILPVLARQEFGSALDLGFMFAALGGGSVIGAALYAIGGHRMSRRLILIGGFLVRALTFWIIVPIPPVWVISFSIVVNAIALEPVNPLVMTVLQERVPERMRGRVFGTIRAIGMATMPAGMLLYGFLLEGVGLRPTLYVLATVNLALPIGMLFVPAFRDMRSPAPTGQATDGAARPQPQGGNA